MPFVSHSKTLSCDTAILLECQKAHGNMYGRNACTCTCINPIAYELWCILCMHRSVSLIATDWYNSHRITLALQLSLFRENLINIIILTAHQVNQLYCCGRNVREASLSSDILTTQLQFHCRMHIKSNNHKKCVEFTKSSCPPKV